MFVPIRITGGEHDVEEGGARVWPLSVSFTQKSETLRGSFGEESCTGLRNCPDFRLYV